MRVLGSNMMLIHCKFPFISPLSFCISCSYSPVPILFLSRWVSKCGEASAESQSLLEELDSALGDQSDNEIVGGRKTHFLTCEREKY